MEGCEVQVLALHIADHHIQCLRTLNLHPMAAARSEFVAGSRVREETYACHGTRDLRFAAVSPDQRAGAGEDLEENWKSAPVSHSQEAQGGT